MDTMEIRPQAGPQTLFLSTSADIAIYGGAAGGGKTFGLLLEALRHAHVPGFNAVIFRREREQVRVAGGLWDEAKGLYPLAGARGREQQLDWTFPSGASVAFDGLQYERDVYEWQGAQICYLGFDELTHFTARQFFYLLSRNRSTCGVRPYVRAGLNPDPDSWVFELVGPWVDERHPLYPTAPGELRWILREGGTTRFVAEGTPDAKSLTFIPANVFDNKILLEKDPGYLANLKAQTAEDQERLLRGSWARIQSPVALWSLDDRVRTIGSRVEIIPGLDSLRVTRPPAEGYARIVVGVDPATKSAETNDETAIVVAALGYDAHAYVLTAVSGHYTPNEAAKIALGYYNHFRADRLVYEENQGGDWVLEVLKSVGTGAAFKGRHVHQGKRLRAEPVSAYYEQGRVHHVGTFGALEGQMCRWDPKDPNWPSPDLIDALALALSELFEGGGMDGRARVTDSLKTNRR